MASGQQSNYMSCSGNEYGVILVAAYNYTRMELVFCHFSLTRPKSDWKYNRYLDVNL